MVSTFAFWRKKRDDRKKRKVAAALASDVDESKKYVSFDKFGFTEVPNVFKFVITLLEIL